MKDDCSGDYIATENDTKINYLVGFFRQISPRESLHASICLCLVMNFSFKVLLQICKIHYKTITLRLTETPIEGV